jgi:hypothetical protein
MHDDGWWGTTAPSSVFVDDGEIEDDGDYDDDDPTGRPSARIVSRPSCSVSGHEEYDRNCYDESNNDVLILPHRRYQDASSPTALSSSKSSSSSSSISIQNCNKSRTTRRPRPARICRHGIPYRCCTRSASIMPSVLRTPSSRLQSARPIPSSTRTSWDATGPTTWIVRLCQRHVRCQPNCQRCVRRTCCWHRRLPRRTARTYTNCYPIAGKR